ncbi:MAG: phosphotransferase family protein [Hyphomicrobiaceae bacterium]|nr:MAG: phosphotransferase family protein [Hyphomicrobiaceae bacterium]
MQVLTGTDLELAAPRFRAAEQTMGQDWPRLALELARAGMRFDRHFEPRQFAGGFGNLNYLISVDGARCVLRRPPPGPVPPGANDMARERRVLSALSPSLHVVPRPIHFSNDATIIGAPFLIMEYRPGLVIGGDLPVGLASRIAGPRLSELLVSFLAELHAIAPASVGLSDFGKPEGFLERTVDGWAKRASLALDSEPQPAALRTVLSWLRTAPTPRGAVALLHNDFKLDNVVLDPGTLAMRAVLDWDMGSRGDALFDLATTLSYWPEPDDPPCMHRLGQMPTAQEGFWRRAEVVERYAQLSGSDVSQLKFYRILAMLKLATVFLQFDARARKHGARDPRLNRVAGIGHELLDFTAELVLKSFPT